MLPPRIPVMPPLLSRLRLLRPNLRTSFREAPIRRTYASKATPNPKPRTKLGTLLIYSQVFLAFHLFNKYLYSIHSTSGISMVPTIPHSYRSYPYILISKLHRNGRNIGVGDVVVYAHPMIPRATGCKRIIGMPGDLVCVMTPGKREEDINVDFEDGEGAQFASVEEEMFRVPEGHCWLAGDNLEWSRDSRIIGAVPLNLVRGKVLAVLWPWSDMKWFGEGLTKPVEGEHEWVAV